MPLRRRRVRVPPSSGEPQKHAILSALEQSEPAGRTSVGSVLTWLGTRLRRKGIVAVFSDFFDDLEPVAEGLRRLVHAGHEPILFQVLDPLELTFEIPHLARLDGLEASGVQKVDPRALRAAYVEEVERHNELLAREARRLRIDYVRCPTQQSVDAVLRTYLARRGARARGGGR